MSIPVPIIRRSDRVVVEAILHVELTSATLIETERLWGRVRRDAVRKLRATGRIAEIPEHYHWNWERKSLKLEWLAYRCLGIEYGGEMQGLLLAKLAGVGARLEPDAGKPIVYIDYLESAPWNLRPMVEMPLYGGIGPVLLRAAVQLSYDEGFRGRIGLHSLPQSEGFYRDECGMLGCGPDPVYEGLAYYEMTREIAARFAGKASGGAL